VRVDGVEVEVRPGMTIAAAVIAAGGWPGVYCGIGVCQQCLVDVEGRGVVRACVTLAAPALTVRTAPGRTTPPAAAAPSP
jgi:predicted molibdopterin-dependent oxidoreductase YjgC